MYHNKSIESTNYRKNSGFTKVSNQFSVPSHMFETIINPK